jgi:F-type H+-transporting ATPase subunit delta
VLSTNHSLQTFFFSPYFSTEEKKDGLGRLLEGAEETFKLPRDCSSSVTGCRRSSASACAYEELWDEEMKLLPVEVTSAVELDEAVVRDIGERSARRRETRSSSPASSIPTSSAESCSAWATSSSTHRLGTD